MVRNGDTENLNNFLKLKDKALNINIQYRVIYSEAREFKDIIVLSVTPHKYEEISR